MSFFLWPFWLISHKTLTLISIYYSSFLALFLISIHCKKQNKCSLHRLSNPMFLTLFSIGLWYFWLCGKRIFQIFYFGRVISALTWLLFVFEGAKERLALETSSIWIFPKIYLSDLLAELQAQTGTFFNFVISLSTRRGRQGLHTAENLCGMKGSDLSYYRAGVDFCKFHSQQPIKSQHHHFVHLDEG